MKKSITQPLYNTPVIEHIHMSSSSEAQCRNVYVM